jgi:dihydroxyacetone kinase-like protein
MNSIDLKKFLRELRNIMSQNKDYLIELDSVVGDGDLGLTMEGGFSAAYEAVAGNNEMDLGKLLYAAGKAMGNAVPSTMGTLMAAGFMNAGKVLKGKTELSNEDCVALFRGYMEGVANLGKAKVGEKTFLDGIAPAVAAMEGAVREGDSREIFAEKAEQAAKKGVENTTTMQALHGRAAIRGIASISLVDPGATVAAFMFEAFAKSLI